MTDKINECAQGILAIADGVHPRSFDLGRERIERLFRDADAQQGEHFSVAQKLRDQLGQLVHGHHGGGAAQFLEDLIEWLDEHHLGR